MSFGWIFKIAGVFQINNVKPTPEGEPSKVRVKVRLNLNGILTIASAALVEKRELTQQENEEDEKLQQGNNMDADFQSEKKDKADQEAQANEPPAPEVQKKSLINVLFLSNSCIDFCRYLSNATRFLYVSLSLTFYLSLTISVSLSV